MTQVATGGPTCCPTNRADAAGTLDPGSVIGRFRVVHELGRGGQGIVYRAVDTVLDREVALKTIPVPGGDDRRSRAAHREARLLSRVDDVHVIGLFDVVEQRACIALVMELVAGRTVQSLARSGALQYDEVQALGIQLAQGLDALHTSGIVHRDIKPANLAITDTGVLKILDLGVATETEPSERRVSGDFETIVGTIPYMAPEQWSGAVDVRCDIWSAGAVLFELATGCRAYDVLGAASADPQHARRRLPQPRELNPDIPKPLDAAIARAMSPDPRRRFQSAREITEVLRDADPPCGVFSINWEALAVPFCPMTA